MGAEINTYCHADMYYVSLAGVEQVEAEYVHIANGRNADHLTWEKNGFKLVPHTSQVADWHDDAELAATHYAEMAELAKALTGCDHALVSGHISRNPETAKAHADYAPIQFVHSDFTENYRERLQANYRRGEPETTAGLKAAGIGQAELEGARRMLILQFWRNVGEAVVDLPIAFCDAETVPIDDMRSVHVPNYADGGFPFDTYAVAAPPSSREHAWYTFPRMSSDEVVAFRTFDSDMATNGQRFWTPHSAFLDPTAPADAAARCSIEVRATCLFS